MEPNAAEVKESKSSARPVQQSEASSRIKRYENGLLNLEKTPSHLIAIVKKNADSPLLRLPAEIRIQIWSFACGGQLVVLRSRLSRTGKGGAVYCQKDEDLIKTAKTLQGFCNHTQNFTRMSSAFHLPEVCRQIYSETVLTSYRENIFVWDFSMFSNKRPMSQLMPVQRRSIQTLQPDRRALHWMMDRGRKLFGNNMLKVLPNLRTLRIDSFALKYVQLFFITHHLDEKQMRLWNQEEWQDNVAKQLASLTEAGVKILFED
ncbi:hypothetical protein C7974DRAFT_470996 [Boeremia exigua]|uniref:uncharacterized protein n=1 Tax=Boeremia exigua TaxID=749465 RepID=UPI001E8ECE52|nr:uncharacterized protein C7974DRAFT_470996 [Boeremia exigua]KAH6638258.1 hypothetical protein C7974DRAFT_470996 [Boeremia exigua]